MTRLTIISLAALLLALLHLIQASGNSTPKKIQIHVPHNIQHHHHTHTKYHFITLPAKTNTTGINPMQGLFPLMPVMPVAPVATPTTTTGAPPILPVNPVPGIQPNALPIPGMMPVAAPPPPRPVMTPVFPQQPLIPLVLARPSAMYTHSNGYDYIDNVARRSQKFIKVEPPPQPSSTTTPQTMKFKTIINVHETKKIPLSELLNIANLANLLQPEPPRRIKVEVMPEKNAYIKQKQPERETVSGSIKHYSLPDVEAEDLHYDPETAAYQMQSRQETTPIDKPEWKKVKELLEKHIHEDFPGLKINAELIDAGSSVDERTDSHNSPTVDLPSVSISDLRHIGYVVIDDNNEKRFVALGDEKQR